MNVTLKDVARALGVNVSTVSRSLSGSYGVDPETRKRVLAAAASLNYRPNRMARGLVTGRSHTLALIVSDIRNPFFAEVARGAEDAARKAGCDLVLCNSDFDPQKQMDYVRSLHEKRVDGILMNSVSALNRAQLDQLTSYQIPVVLLNRPKPARQFSTVCPDNAAGGRLAAEYLAGLGHRRIAHITGPRGHGNLTDRAAAFRRSLEKAGVPAPVILYGENSYRGGHEMALRLVERHPEITAVFAGNDVMAFGCLQALTEKGIRVPACVSVLGFDNVEVSAIVSPPLTTIHQLKYEMGQAAVQLLHEMIQRRDGGVNEHRLLGVKLVERQSCAPPRPSAG